MGTAIKHPVPDQVKPTFVIFDILALGQFIPERQSVRMSKITNPVWHRMLYSCTHMATLGVKALKMYHRFTKMDISETV